jgi:hypothetical protein
MMTSGKQCVAVAAAPLLTVHHPREVGPSVKVADTMPIEIIVVVADRAAVVVAAMDGGDNRPSVNDL